MLARAEGRHREATRLDAAGGGGVQTMREAIDEYARCARAAAKHGAAARERLRAIDAAADERRRTGARGYV